MGERWVILYLEPRLMLRLWKRPLNRGLSELSGLSAGAGSAVSAPPGSISLVTLSASKAFIFMEVIMGSPRSILALCVNWPEEGLVLRRVYSLLYPPLRSVRGYVRCSDGAMVRRVGLSIC